MKNLKVLLENVETSILASVPAVLGIIIGIIWGRISQVQYQNQPPKPMNSFIVGIIFLIWSLSFVIVIWRKEFPQILTAKGNTALIYGWLGLITCLFFGITLMGKAFFY